MNQEKMKPKTRNENIVVQEMNKEVLIYDLKTNKAFCLNETSAIIYQLCDGTRNIHEIVQSFNQITKNSITDDLIWLALDKFKQDNLLEDESIEINFNGLSRRQLIRKIGFASMIALPVVSSVVAPTSAQAASGPTNLAFGSACSSSGQCTSGNCAAGPPNPPTCCAAGATQNRSPGLSVRTQAFINTPCSNYPDSASVIAAIPANPANCCSNNIVGICTDLGSGFTRLEVNCV